MLTSNDAICVVERIASRPPIKLAQDYERDGILHCGTCGEPKQAWIDWFPDKDGNPTKNLVRIMCKCDMEKERIEKEHKAQDDFDDAMRTVRTALHTQRDEVRWIFDMDSDPNNPIAKTCRRYVEQWDEMRRNNIGILFFGNKGVGKSFYASCIYNALQERRVLVGFSSAPNLMNILHAWDKTEIFSALTRVQLLVIDDLGAERDSSYAAEQMYSVIDARYKTGKPTIVTTNIDIEDMKQESDWGRSRIYDRVIEMCPIPLKMAGDSKRVAIADERKQLAKNFLDWTRRNTTDGN